MDFVTRHVDSLLSTLAAERRRRGFSQSDVAVYLGVARPTVSLWETGGQIPSLPTFRRYADAMGMVPVLVPWRAIADSLLDREVVEAGDGTAFVIRR